MERPLVIMLGHQAMVGKDTLGEFLVQKDGFVRFGFADKLKSVVADLYGFSKEQMYAEQKNVPDERYIKRTMRMALGPHRHTYYTPREVLQDFGQEQRERFQDIWADYVFRQIQNSTNLKFVITDFRFPNEYTKALDYVEANGWDLRTVKITRPESERGSFAGSSDISEIALNNFQFDYELLNTTNRGKEDLYNRFNNIVMQKAPTQTVTFDFGAFIKGELS